MPMLMICRYTVTRMLVSEQIMLQRFRDCANRLKLNPSKTELIWFYSGRRQLSFVENEIELLGSRIAPVHTVRDLGVILDSNMTMSQHVLRVCQNFYFQIRLIRRLGKALSVESKLLLVHALVHSRLDYCNSVLVHLPWSLVQQLQSVLNSAARLIFALKRFDHITPAWYHLVRRRKFNFRWRGPPDSSISSLILVGWCEEGHPATKNLLQLSQG